MNEINNEIQPDLLIDRNTEGYKVGYKEYIIIAILVIIIIVLIFFLFGYSKATPEAKTESVKPEQTVKNTEEIKKEATELANDFKDTETEEKQVEN